MALKVDQGMPMKFDAEVEVEAGEVEDSKLVNPYLIAAASGQGAVEEVPLDSYNPSQ